MVVRSQSELRETCSNIPASSWKIKVLGWESLVIHYILMSSLFQSFSHCTRMSPQLVRSQNSSYSFWIHYSFSLQIVLISKLSIFFNKAKALFTRPWDFSIDCFELDKCLGDLGSFLPQRLVIITDRSGIKNTLVCFSSRFDFISLSCQTQLLTRHIHCEVCVSVKSK